MGSKNDGRSLPAMPTQTMATGEDGEVAEDAEDAAFAPGAFEEAIPGAHSQGQ